MCLDLNFLFLFIYSSFPRISESLKIRNSSSYFIYLFLLEYKQRIIKRSKKKKKSKKRKYKNITGLLLNLTLLPPYSGKRTLSPICTDTGISFPSYLIIRNCNILQNLQVQNAFIKKKVSPYLFLQVQLKQQLLL